MLTISGGIALGLVFFGFAFLRWRFSTVTEGMEEHTRVRWRDAENKRAANLSKEQIAAVGWTEERLDALANLVRQGFSCICAGADKWNELPRLTRDIADVCNTTLPYAYWLMWDLSWCCANPTKLRWELLKKIRGGHPQSPVWQQLAARQCGHIDWLR